MPFDYAQWQLIGQGRRVPQQVSDWFRANEIWTNGQARMQQLAAFDRPLPGLIARMMPPSSGAINLSEMPDIATMGGMSVQEITRMSGEFLSAGGRFTTTALDFDNNGSGADESLPRTESQVFARPSRPSSRVPRQSIYTPPPPNPVAAGLQQKIDQMQEKLDKQDRELKAKRPSPGTSLPKGRQKKARKDTT